MIALSGAERLLLKRADIKDHEVVRAIMEAREEALESLYESKAKTARDTYERLAFRRGAESVERLNDMTEDDLTDAYEQGYEAARTDIYRDARIEIAEQRDAEEFEACLILHVDQNHRAPSRWCNEGMCAYVMGGLRDGDRRVPA